DQQREWDDHQADQGPHHGGQPEQAADREYEPGDHHPPGPEEVPDHSHENFLAGRPASEPGWLLTACPLPRPFHTAHFAVQRWRKAASASTISGATVSPKFGSQSEALPHAYGRRRGLRKHMTLSRIGRISRALVASMAVVLGMSACGGYTTGFMWVLGTQYNQIAGFKIDDYTGNLTNMVKSPYSSGGANPVSISVRFGGNFVFVANKGTYDKNGVSNGDGNVAVFGVG